jgi:GNAT superfamily N-acetyltransferase
VPPPTTTHATTAEDEIAALKLIADSVAQQRQLAATALICHPLILALYVATLAILTKLFCKGRSADLAIVLTTGAVVTMTGLIGIRWAVGGYLVRAEEVGTWDWLDEGEGRGWGRWEEDEVLVTRLGEEVIGALVIRGVRGSEPGGAGGRNHAKKRQRSNSSAGGNGSSRTKGVIRAWTVRQKFRREGVGGALLEEAVCWCRERGWNGPVFADDHANSGRVLPGMFNGGFEKRETRARRMLESYIEDANAVWGNGKGGKAKR